MILVDANLLLFAVDRGSPFQGPSQQWLEGKLNGDKRVALPWPSLLAFLRISTHPRVFPTPLSAEVAWAQVATWLACTPVWVPTPTARHAEVLGSLMARYRPTGNLVPDAHLAALALEHGLTVCSADTDFARFTEVRWVNPLAGGLS